MQAVEVKSEHHGESDTHYSHPPKRSGSRAAVRRLVLAAIIVCGACGDDVTPSDEDTVGQLLTCAGPPFAPAVFERPANAESGDSEEAAALRDALRTGAKPQHGWRELGRSDAEVAFATGDPPVLSGYVVLRRKGGAWTYAQSGSTCVVRSHRPGLQAGRWGIDPESADAAKTSTEIRLLVNDHGCASGVAPEERLLDPIVESDDESITITFFARPVSGDQTCPSHPPVKRTVRLREPLGDRVLLDGGLYPPQPPCRIEHGVCINERDEFLGGD